MVGFLAAVPLGAQSAARAPRASLILTNGRVFTADSAAPWATAIAIRGDRIIAVGTDAQIEALAGPSTVRTDVRGRLVIPGLNDAHTHLTFAVPAGVSLRFDGDPIAGPAPNVLLDSIAALATRTPPGTWLRGPLGLRAIGDTALRRAALDRVAPLHPVALFAVWGHVSLGNSRALRAAGIADTAVDPIGGRFERVANTRTISGLMDEYAQWPLWEADVAANYAPSKRLGTPGVVGALRAEAESLSVRGVTSVQNMSTPFNAEQALRTFRSASLPLRVRLFAMPGTTAHARVLQPWLALPRTLSPLVRRNGVKYLVDGTPIEGNALTRTAQRGRPGAHGRLAFPVDTLRAILREAITSREPLALHVVGDSALAIVLDAMEQTAPDSVWRPLRVRLEHANDVRGATVARVRRLGIVIGQPRTETSPVRTWLAAGIPVAYGSDASGEPWRDYQQFVSRRDTTQSLTREQALLLMTRYAAYAEFAEQEKGRIAVGMLADIVVLSQDVLAVPAELLPATRSVMTVLGGEATCRQKALNCQLPR